MNDKSANLISLFASSSTLICCALPSLFVTIGAGASLASLVTIFPLLITLSKYKVYITLSTLIALIIAGIVNYKTYHLPCPVDPALGATCMKQRKRSRYLYYSSILIFLFATIFTYLIPRRI
jgi:hypothetical protein